MGIPKGITDEDFIKAYYQAHNAGLSLVSVKKALGIHASSVRNRVESLAAKGIKLPELTDGRALRYKNGPVSVSNSKPPKTPKPKHRLIRATPAAPKPHNNGHTTLVTTEDYIRAHQSSNNWQEVAQKTGLDIAACQSRAYVLKKAFKALGKAPLKKFASFTTAKRDYAALAALAESLLPKETPQ